MTSPHAQPDRGSRRGSIIAIAFGCVVFLLLLGLVVAGISRPDPPAFVPTPLAEKPARGALVGPRVFTVDASDPVRWRHFSFERGTIVDPATGVSWDLAFRRFQVIVNGGPGFAGGGGALDLGPVRFDSVRRLPGDGYLSNAVASDTTHPALATWYDYSYLSHLLSPSDRVYAIRTAEGRYAKLQFIGYYCPGATPGCVTFRYVYQGAGGMGVEPERAPATEAPARSDPVRDPE